MASPYMFPKGTQIYYTTKASQVASPPATPDALPSVYPLTGGDVGTDPATTWVPFYCVESVEGFGQFTPELADHRCINGASTIVEKLPTGFITPSTFNMTNSFRQDEWSLFDGLAYNRGVVRILFVFPLVDTQTLPLRIAYRYYVTSSSINPNNLSDTVKETFAFEQAFDNGVKVLGS